MAVENLPDIPNYVPVAYVYAIFCVEGNSGFLKVGYSTEPFKRVSGIIGGSPLTPTRIGMAKIGTTKDGLAVEARLHKFLAGHRVAQEWFKYDLSDLAQKAEFDKYSKRGFSSQWATFPYEAMKEMLRKESAKAFAIQQTRKRTRHTPYDRHWMNGTKGAGKGSTFREREAARERYKNCKLSSLK